MLEHLGRHLGTPDRLLGHEEIEKAFHSQQVCFLYDFIYGTLNFLILDDAIKEKRVPGQQRFKDIDGNELWTNEGNSLPYRRLLSWHAARTFQRYGRLHEFEKYTKLSRDVKFPEEAALATIIKEGMAASIKNDDD